MRSGCGGGLVVSGYRDDTVGSMWTVGWTWRQDGDGMGQWGGGMEAQGHWKGRVWAWLPRRGEDEEVKIGLGQVRQPSIYSTRMR